MHHVLKKKMVKVTPPLKSLLVLLPEIHTLHSISKWVCWIQNLVKVISSNFKQQKWKQDS